MEFKPKNREWVKNAAIIFLAVLLVLTFFSNTFMNRSLPEVATQYVTNGSIMAQVRGTGTVSAIGSHQVKAEDTREIRAVMVKVGQQVNAGDTLFILGKGDSAELEAAQDELYRLQTSYQTSALDTPTFDYSADKRRISNAEEELEAARQAEDAAYKKVQASTPGSQLDEARKRLESAVIVRDKYSEAYNNMLDEKKAALDSAEFELTNAKSAYNIAVSARDELIASGTASEEEIAAAKEAVVNAEADVTAKTAIRDNALAALAAVSSEELDKAQAEVDKWQAEVDSILNASSPYTEAYKQAVAARKAAEENLLTLQETLKDKMAADQKSQQLSSINLSEISRQIEKQKKKIRELSGGEENEIVANVSGIVQSVDCTAGDTKLKDDVLCSIEVPDMGYTLSFSVTNDQAKRLRPGDSAKVSNYYWGSEIVATLSTIKVDPKSPQTSKLLTFDLTGDVTAGSELTISVGQKSAGYDVIVPNSSIRSDTNGSFVLIIEAKNSPLGNRYIARRVDVEVLASDDTNSAVSGDLGYGDYVITTSNAPVKNGDMVRMPES